MEGLLNVWKQAEGDGDGAQPTVSASALWCWSSFDNALRRIKEGIK